MKLSSLCSVCIPDTYNPIKKDEWDEDIDPKIYCDNNNIIIESVISDVAVKKIKSYDTMMETNESVFTTKNKLYCGE
jgi:hypothetical protein